MKTIDPLTFKEVFERSAMRNHRGIQARVQISASPSCRQTDRETDKQTDSQKATNRDRQHRREQAKEQYEKGEGEEKLLASETMTFLRELLQYPRL